MASLNQLLNEIDVVCRNISTDVEVLSITDDSRQVQFGTLFLAWEGTHASGADFAESAIAAGAVGVVSIKPMPNQFVGQWIQVQNQMYARRILAERFYNNPFSAISVHAVTGTNGKTTTAFIMAEVLQAMGRTVALLGTIEKRIGKQSWPSSLTTPGYLELMHFANQARNEGVTDLVMEVSSHSLHQGRIDGIQFASGLFSNLTQDHLDYHITMEAYYQAKKLLFTTYNAQKQIINVDDEYGQRLALEMKAVGCSVITVSRKGNAADIYPSEIKMTEDGIVLRVPCLSDGVLQSHLCGEFNVDNILLVAGWAFSLGFSGRDFSEAISKVKVPGRFELVYADNGKRVVVDYAHTPDALERVLLTAKSICRNRLWVVFGCGGDRDKGKRPLMGAIADRLADFSIVTSDNPRTENASVIVQEIVAGMTSESKRFVIEDREQAIQYACKQLQDGDWLVVAGKGHEDYQIIGKVKYPFDDRKKVVEAMA